MRRIGQKTELWKDEDGNETYIIGHKFADSLRNELPENARVTWSCDVDSAFEAQYQHMKFKRYWISVAIMKIRSVFSSTYRGQTYEEQDWE